MLQEQLPEEPIEDVLHDGVILCSVMQTLKPGCIAKVWVWGGLGGGGRRGGDKQAGGAAQACFCVAAIFNQRALFR